MLWRRADGRCGICGNTVDPHEIAFDHTIPLTRGGADALKNIQVAHNTCNMQKGARLPGEAPPPRKTTLATAPEGGLVLLTVAEVAQYLHVSHELVLEWLRAGRLRGYRPGGTKAGWRVRQADVEAFLAAAASPAGDERAAGSSRLAQLQAVRQQGSTDRPFDVSVVDLVRQVRVGENE